MRRQIGSLNPQTPKMGFVNGALRLFAVHPSACYIYASQKLLIGSEIVTRGGMEAQFTKHQWETRDQDHAITMLEDQTNFERSWGYYVEEDCIPEAGGLRDLFEALDADGKYVVAFRLAENKATLEQIVNELKENNLLGEDGVAPERKEEPAEEKPLVLGCPACSAQFDASKVPNAQAVLKNHLRSAHPEWKGDEAEVTEPAGARA